MPQELTVIKMENFPGFLVSFDGEKWWKTEALPGAVESILDVMWVYSEYHVCTAHMIDGTYAIYQSYHQINDGPGDLHWRLVLATSERMYSLVRPDYGRVLISTSGGWWRSENSGTTWTKVSTQAPGCFGVKELTNDILVAVDGKTVWRSANAGTTWTKATRYGYGGDLIAITTYPAIDGTYSDLLVGCTATNAPDFSSNDRHDYKSILIYSDDGGSTFQTLPGWSDWWSRPSCGPGYTIKEEYVTDIELASIDSDGLPYLAVEVKMPNGLSRVYRTYRTTGYQQSFHFLARFDAPTSVSNSLTSEEVQTAESDLVTHRLVFSGTDGTTGLIKVSTDRAYTWTTTLATTLDVYTGSDLTTRDTKNNPFVGDSYVQYAWLEPFCHNGFKPIGGYVLKHQSYDINAEILMSYQPAKKQYTSDGFIQGKSVAYMRSGAQLVQDKLASYNIDTHIGKHTVTTYDADALAQAIVKITYRESGYLSGPQGRTYTAGGLIVKSEFPIIILPQGFAVRFPAQTELGFPYDSRWEG